MKTVLVALVAVALLTAGVADLAVTFPHHIEILSAAAVPALPSAGAYSVKLFCRAHRISVAQYYKMRSEKWGPREMRVGSRVLISVEAAAIWRREREEAALTAPPNRIPGRRDDDQHDNATSP